MAGVARGERVKGSLGDKNGSQRDFTIHHESRSLFGVDSGKVDYVWKVLLGYNEESYMHHAVSGANTFLTGTRKSRWPCALMMHDGRAHKPAELSPSGHNGGSAVMLALVVFGTCVILVRLSSERGKV